MANVGKGPAGYPLTGRGTASPSGATFLPIGTDSGLTAHGVLIAEGSGAFVAISTGNTGQVLTSNGAGSDPSFQPVSSSGSITTITGNTGGAQSPSSGNFNILGTGSITVAGTANTETVQLTGLTNHALQVGAGTATLTQLGAGTTGQVLQTNTTADPTWSTATYPSTATGTGTILRANGTNWVASTATYPDTAGTSGNILTSNGTNWVSSAPSSPFSPNSTVQIFDDFIGENISTSTLYCIGQQVWAQSSTNPWIGYPTASNAHPGVIGNTALAVGAYTALLLSSDSINHPTMILGGGAITLNWVVNINTLSNGTNRYTFSLGMGDTINLADQVNGIYLQYSDNINSGNWNIVTANASTRTTTTTSTAVTTGWHNISVTVNAAGTSIGYLVDGVSLGTITTNIPTAAIAPYLNAVRVAGTVAANSLWVDLFYMTQTLTVAR